MSSIEPGIVNWDVFQSKRTVEIYRQNEGLQLAEQSIFGLIKDKLGFMKMLDIGVGAGRTTHHFAPLVKEYTGIDYSQNMVNACQERFAHLHFLRSDARSMGSFNDSLFDLILFSYNGIDYINHDDRAKALREIKRVGRPGGLFCFSSHNLGYIRNFLKVPLNRNIVPAYQRYCQTTQILKSQLPYAFIRDGGEDFKLLTYYVKPSQQVKVLHELGFREIRLFLEKTGQQIMDISRIDDYSQDRWLYYLCHI
jgi:ubiquinone/menaquinone biosynthesis C-methylase UbiE